MSIDKKCLSPSIVNRAIILVTSKPDEGYFGISETSFNTSDFRHKEYINSTELSKYIWKLKDKPETLLITWNIMSVVNCRPRRGVCRLFLTEKLWLLKHFNDANLLNKKSKFISKCGLENKLVIKSTERR